MVITAMVALAASCNSSPSTLSYTLDGNLDYAANSGNIEKFKDSTFVSAYVGMDSYSYLMSNYENSVMNGGWTLSLKRGQLDANGMVTPFSSAGTSAGAGKSAVYAVFYDNPDASAMVKHDIQFSTSNLTSFTCILYGFMINNSGAVIHFVNEGNLQQGDYMKVVVTGYKNEAVTGTDEKYLVDYRTSELKVVSDWEAFTFTSLKSSVDAVDFKIESSRLDFPPYFCMDNFTASISMEY